MQRCLYMWTHIPTSENQIFNIKQETAGRATRIYDTLKVCMYKFEKQPLIPVIGPA